MTFNRQEVTAGGTDKKVITELLKLENLAES